MKILILFVQHGNSKYPGAFERLLKLYERFSEVDYHAVLIDNALPIETSVSLGPKAELIGGDNSCWEFTSWDTGLQRFWGVLDQYDGVNIVTSAFEQGFSEFYSYIDNSTFAYLKAHPNVAFGQLDSSYADLYRLFGRDFRTWLCTKFILLSVDTVRKLGKFLMNFTPEQLFQESLSQPFKSGCFVSENYQRSLYRWLIRNEKYRELQWHSAFDLTQQSLPMFHQKMFSIINEKYLSIRLRELGIKILDFTWSYLKDCQFDPSFIPDELAQIKERNQRFFNHPVVESFSQAINEEESVNQLINLKKSCPRIPFMMF